MKTTIGFVMLYLGLIFSGCATFKTPVNGMYDQAGQRNNVAEKVNVLFVFQHYKQAIGYDAVPKLTSPFQNGFNDIFQDALGEMSNINKFDTWSIDAAVINNAQKNEELNSLKEEYDYTFDMKFRRENSFAKVFVGTFFSTVSLTLLPIRYRYKYMVDVDVYDQKQQLIKTYSRDAYLDTWVQTALIIIYPFHNDQEKGEQLYVEFMHDIFKQVESEKILNKNSQE